MNKVILLARTHTVRTLRSIARITDIVPMLVSFPRGRKPQVIALGTETVVVQSTPVAPKKKVAQGSRPSFMRFPVREQMLFAKRLAMILRSGTPILEGLHMLGDQATSRGSKYIYTSLINDVSRGQPLSTALAKFEDIFGEFCVNIVRVGETSGTLHENLDYLAEELKKSHALKGKVVGALVYPIVILVATVGISLSLTLFIFPKITPIFASFKTQLPLSTRILMGLSSGLLHYGWLILIGLIVFVIATIFIMRIESVKLVMHRFMLRIPVVGVLARYYNISNVSRTLGLLLKSDVPILQAFEIIAASSRNRAYRAALNTAALEIMKGHRISVQLSKDRLLFPPLMTQMLGVGEQTGNLSGSLIYLSQMYEEEINDLTKNLTTMLEPILMVVMGLIVGFIAISIITPIYGITSNLTPH